MISQLKNMLPLSLKQFLREALGLNKKKVYSEYGVKAILDEQEGNNRIKTLIGTGKPLMVARLGSTEQACIYNYIRIQNKKLSSWEKYVVDTMPNNSGFFPSSPETLERFSIEMLKHLKNVDVLGVWFNPGEKYICENICPQAEFVLLRAIEPYYFKNPWSKILEGKRVLVIHPFQTSIEEQYKKHDLLFEDKNVLPAFDLLTIKAVQSRGNNQTDFASWFDALQYMQDEIQKKDFDIAIIGCGAYGFPLASFVKTLGKQAIHLGGATQILFGVKGKRWDNMETVNRFYNENWKRPFPYESGGSQAWSKTAKDYW